MAAVSSLKNMALCLTLVCLACAAVLGGIYALTAEPIRAANESILKASIGRVLPQGGEISDVRTAEADGQAYEYYTWTEGAEVKAYAVKSSAIGFGGRLDVMVGVLSDGTVYNTSVISHSETPGLGAKCQTDERFLSQFRGLSPEATLKVAQDGGSIDAITASTITSRAYTLAVENAVALVKTLTGKED